MCLCLRRVFWSLLFTICLFTIKSLWKSAEATDVLFFVLEWASLNVFHAILRERPNVIAARRDL